MISFLSSARRWMLSCVMALPAAKTSSERVVLVDMDGVLCDFEAQFLGRWRSAYPDARWVPLAERRTHYVDMDPSGAYDTRRSHAVIKEPGFYDTMPPIEGSVEAVLALEAELGVEVRICTSPFGSGDDATRCEQEKKAWVKRHLGEHWLSEGKFLCLKDKTSVPGTLLIDDKPTPEKHWRLRSSQPSWRHVVFTQPFNSDDPECDSKPRMDGWARWRDVLLPLL
mmetsp:Transcript_58077/g.131311  ORF Transcript_58077/g.131311 Transcript_58077/m.131311 type:complete len:225 (+) Transcript_58077:14-688(+)